MLSPKNSMPSSAKANITMKRTQQKFVMAGKDANTTRTTCWMDFHRRIWHTSPHHSHLHRQHHQWEERVTRLQQHGMG